MSILTLSGSPTERSRSAELADYVAAALAARGAQVGQLALRDLPAEALLRLHHNDEALSAALGQVADADVVVIATPIYKAAYTGLLKAFLDLLPQDGLRGKWVLPLATGGSLAHLLALDYALRPVLTALGAEHVLQSVFAADAQVVREGPHTTFAIELQTRLDESVKRISDWRGLTRVPTSPPMRLIAARC